MLKFLVLSYNNTKVNISGLRMCKYSDNFLLTHKHDTHTVTLTVSCINSS